ncbi:MAG: aminotransferase class V-fold PLP-dependent enzyme [Algisphaera sp.]
MIYLDNAATSFPKAPGVGEAMAAFIQRDAANPGRAGYRMAVAAERMVDDVRLKLTRLFNGAGHERMVLTHNGTDALNMAIKGVVGACGGQGLVPHVVTTVLEHNSVNRPLQALADAGRIALTRVDCDDSGRVDPEDIAAALTSETKLVVLTHASNVTGVIQDAAAVGALCRKRGVLFLLDAAQTAGVVGVDIEAMQIDLLAFPGHKGLLGPTGTGGLYVGERCPGSGEATTAGRFAPFREGGTGGDSAASVQPLGYPHYLEAGTPNTVGLAGLQVAVDVVQSKPLAKVLAHEQRLCATLVEWVESCVGCRLLGSADPTSRVGTVSFGVEGLEASDVALILDDSFDIAVRAGLHCAPYTHRRFGTFPSGAVRVSVGALTTADEIGRLIEALGEIVG